VLFSLRLLALYINDELTEKCHALTRSMNILKADAMLVSCCIRALLGFGCEVLVSPTICSRKNINFLRRRMEQHVCACFIFMLMPLRLLVLGRGGKAIYIRD
jgi:hypothetical protein